MAIVTYTAIAYTAITYISITCQGMVDIKAFIHRDFKTVFPVLVKLFYLFKFFLGQNNL